MTSPESHICQNCKAPFEIDAQDFDFYAKIQVPPPTFCPLCRKQRRLTWRNDTTLYTRPCGLCGKSTVTLYAPNSGMNIYCSKCWWSDTWDPKSYQQDYDFSRNFFEQFVELQHKVPALAMVNDNGIGSVNCEYTHDFAFSKNCYMTFVAWKMEDCAYNYYVINGKEIYDSLNCMGECENVYETVFTEKCYRCRFVYYSVACSDCAFSYDCRDCTDCFMCVGLRHKKYCFQNKQLSKDEYESVLASYHLDTHTGVQKAKSEFEPMLFRYPRRFAVLRNCVNCTGDSLIYGKNSKFCFNVQRPEDDKWIENADSPKQSYDLSVGGELEQCYEGITPDHSFHSRFAIFSWKNNEVAYVDGCHSSQNLFGCVGLKKGEYCILNKPYSKDEYLELVPRIKLQMSEMPYRDKHGCSYAYGEFFPSELSYFKYNESEANLFFPLTEEQVKANGWRWQNELQFTSGRETLALENIPDSIRDVSDDILKEILACRNCHRNFKIVPQEFSYYKKIQTPIPHLCFYCRHKDRLRLRNPFKLNVRDCDCTGQSSRNGVYTNTGSHAHGTNPCDTKFETPYTLNSKEIVYCEACYNSEIA